ncbi:zinc-binding dehydrogenase [Nocardia otitidiscaviarum]|uniref:zinc-binding dehydrogenase n=1 Tax=Nocardia otitidiscaviarum TaxID=1823 RepID=UPI0018931E47|nr:zinc-binding dehydrogenase [Nocardia otitidiscaviarum]MBF6177497.1 zinc-binding dehydrogenase [Nocardia otitidiscaviarum]
MRVVEAKSFGGPEVLEVTRVADPVAGPGEVVIDVAAADVMFLDVILRGGLGVDFFPVAPPYVPGGAVAGVVSAVGSGVDASWIGRRVATATAASAVGGGKPVGGYAERALAKAEALAVIPEGVDFTQAAALVHDGRTAFTVAEAAGIGPGSRVLVTAAGGGVGTILVQRAKAAGATVVAAARGRVKLQLAQRLGADAVVDYTEPDWTDRVRSALGGAGVDIVFDGAGGDLGRRALATMADGSRIIGFGNAAGGFAEFDDQAAAARNITIVSLMDLTNSDIDWEPALGRALAEVAAGRLEVVVGQTFPLERASEAHLAIESRTAVGRTLLTV